MAGGLVSGESRAHWERLQNGRSTKILTPQDSAALLLRDQPAKKRPTAPLKVVSGAAPLEAKNSSTLPLLQKVQPQGTNLRMLKKVEQEKVQGKRPRESDYCLEKKRQEDDDDHVRKRRRLQQEQLMRRRQSEIMKQNEVDELKKIKQQQEINKQREKLKREEQEMLKKKAEEEEKKREKREQARAAARKALQKVERDGKRNVQDHYKTMKQFAALINYAPDQFNYFYP